MKLRVYLTFTCIYVSFTCFGSSFDKLIEAISKNDSIRVTSLLESKTDPNEVTKNKVTALIYATKLSNETIVEALLDAKADPNLTVAGLAALHFAAVKGLDNIAHLLIRQGANVDHLDAKNYSALCLAIIKEKNSMVKILIEAKADPNSNPYHSPLESPILNGDVSLVKFLLESNANPNFISDGGDPSDPRFTPLMRASSYGRTEIVILLLAEGADPNKINSRIETALDIAKNNSHEKVVKILKPLTRAITEEKKKLRFLTYIKNLIAKIKRPRSRFRQH